MSTLEHPSARRLAHALERETVRLMVQRSGWPSVQSLGWRLVQRWASTLVLRSLVHHWAPPSERSWVRPTGRPTVKMSAKPWVLRSEIESKTMGNAPDTRSQTARCNQSQSTVVRLECRNRLQSGLPWALRWARQLESQSGCVWALRMGWRMEWSSEMQLDPRLDRQSGPPMASALVPRMALRWEQKSAIRWEHPSGCVLGSL